VSVIYMPNVTQGQTIANRVWGVGAHHPYDAIGPITKEQALALIGVEWYYDWHYQPAVFAGIESVPMYWDATVVGKPLGGNSIWRLGFNEPDIASQAGMTPAQGAAFWRQIEQDPQNQNAKLVAPTPSSEGNQWRWDWKAEYQARYGRSPKVDAVGVHVYPQTWSYFLQTMDDAWAFAQAFGVKLWVTEYAFLPCWSANDVNLAKMTQHFIDNPGRFERWAPFILSCSGLESWSFGAKCNTSLVNFSTGQLTPIGQAYTAMHPAVDYADPRADVNQDGKVDISDIVIVGSSFGKPIKRAT